MRHVGVVGVQISTSYRNEHENPVLLVPRTGAKVGLLAGGWGQRDLPICLGEVEDGDESGSP